eukprot:scaffold9586_cov109-Cylindrotheca_fusiformis.AAC.4
MPTSGTNLPSAVVPVSSDDQGATASSPPSATDLMIVTFHNTATDAVWCHQIPASPLSNPSLPVRLCSDATIGENVDSMPHPLQARPHIASAIRFSGWSILPTPPKTPTYR